MLLQAAVSHWVLPAKAYNFQVMQDSYILRLLVKCWPTAVFVRHHLC